MIRAPLVIANWKMHATTAEARRLAGEVRDQLGSRPDAAVVLCPPFTALAAVGEAVRGSEIGLGAQNCHWEKQGPHTGEISVPMLVELGCRAVLVGHSERRRDGSETDAQINRKLQAALAAGVMPVLCVGETHDERRQGLTFMTVEGQLRAGLAGLEPQAIGACTLAYEPVWAIGTGVHATPAQAGEVHGYLRGILSELTSKEAAQQVRILYGGSVKPDNAGELAAETEIDGALVGGASLDAKAFVEIVERVAGRTGPAAKGE